MSDIYSDAATLRAAGYFASDAEELDQLALNLHRLAPNAAHPHAAQPGNMPSVGDLVEELHMARGLLRRFASAPETWGDEDRCEYCGESLLAITEMGGYTDLSPLRHAPTCPWRQAAEYIKGLEGKS